MNQWNELQSLENEEDICKLYDIYTERNFPYEVRDLFPAWFEEQDWNFDEKLPREDLRLQQIWTNLLTMLQEQLPTGGLLPRMRLVSIKIQLLKSFGDNPKLFVATVRDILNDEKELLSSVNTRKNTFWNWKNGALIIGCGITGVLAAPVFLGVAGFTASGVAAGSVAAAAQSVIYGGATTGAFSLLQSAGVVGLGAAGNAAAGAAGAAVGATGAAAYKKYSKK